MNTVRRDVLTVTRIKHPLSTKLSCIAGKNGNPDLDNILKVACSERACMARDCEDGAHILIARRQDASEEEVACARKIVADAPCPTTLKRL
jgi:hypothetical protein